MIIAQPMLAITADQFYRLSGIHQRRSDFTRNRQAHSEWRSLLPFPGRRREGKALLEAIFTVLIPLDDLIRTALVSVCGVGLRSESSVNLDAIAIDAHRSRSGRQHSATITVTAQPEPRL